MAGHEDDDRRAALLEPICAHLLAHGLERSSLRELATSAATSDRMLLYYFRDKSDLMAAAMDRLCDILRDRLEALRMPEPLDEAALRHALLDLVLTDEVWPFLQVWLEIVARGGRGDPVFRRTGERIASNYLDWIAGQSAAPTDAARREVAARLLPLVDGLIVLKAVGLAEVCAASWTDGRPGSR